MSKPTEPFDFGGRQYEVTVTEHNERETGDGGEGWLARSWVEVEATAIKIIDDLDNEVTSPGDELEIAAWDKAEEFFNGTHSHTG